MRACTNITLRLATHFQFFFGPPACPLPPPPQILDLSLPFFPSPPRAVGFPDCITSRGGGYIFLVQIISGLTFWRYVSLLLVLCLMYIRNIYASIYVFQHFFFIYFPFILYPILTVLSLIPSFGYFQHLPFDIVPSQHGHSGGEGAAVQPVDVRPGDGASLHRPDGPARPQGGQGEGRPPHPTPPHEQTQPPIDNRRHTALHVGGLTKHTHTTRPIP